MLTVEGRRRPRLRGGEGDGAEKHRKFGQHSVKVKERALQRNASGQKEKGRREKQKTVRAAEGSRSSSFYGAGDAVAHSVDCNTVDR